MGGLKSAEIDQVEWLEWGNLPHRRKLVAARANVSMRFLHLHPLRPHKSALSRSVTIKSGEGSGRFGIQSGRVRPIPRKLCNLVFGAPN